MLQLAEGEITRLRREFKLVLEAREAAALCARLSTLAGGYFPPSTRITSVYFDRPGHPLARRALRNPANCLKVRTKEYSPDVGANGVARVVLEVKRERGGVTRKRRVWVPRTWLVQELEGGVRLLPLIVGGSLKPTLAVTYQRYVFQCSRAWRVTVDRDIGFHRVTSELALGGARLDVERLGPPLARDERVVVEVKHLGEALPEWLVALRQEGRPAYSKFAEGMVRIHNFIADGILGG